MRVFTSPSSTAIFSRCPQCGAVTRIKLVEPDLKEPSKERHVFECDECCLPRTYWPPNQNWRSVNEWKVASFILSSAVSRCSSRVQPLGLLICRTDVETQHQQDLLCCRSARARALQTAP